MLSMLLLLLTGCKSGYNAANLTGGIELTSDAILAGGPYIASLGEDGLFYCNGNLLYYYDLESQQSYVLCDKANCSHDYEACNAYFPSYTYGSTLGNVAEYNGMVYCTWLNAETEEDASYELIRIDVQNGGVRTVVASFPLLYRSFNMENDESIYGWNAASMGNVYFCGDYAWINALGILNYNDDCYDCWIRVDLNTGEQQEYLKHDTTGDFGDVVQMSFITQDYLFYSTTSYEGEHLDEDAFIEKYGEDGNYELYGQTGTGYDDYWVTVVNNCPKAYGFYAYRLSDDTEVELDAGTLDFGTIIPNAIIGYEDGKILFEETDYSNSTPVKIWSIDPDTLERTQLLQLEGSVLNISYDGNCVLSDGTLLYQTDTDNPDITSIYFYDLAIGESTHLYDSDTLLPFQIYYEVNGGYLGQRSDEEDLLIYDWISKEDYEAGNFDQMTTYKLD
jgi:hypothetical protein